MKKITAVLLIFCLLLCACAGRTGQSDPGSSSRTEVSGSSMPDAGNDADKTEGPADTEDISPADGDDGAVWSVSLRELMGRPVEVNRLALAGDGTIYAIAEEFNDNNTPSTRPYLVAYDPSTEEMSKVGWDADYVYRLSVLEDGRLGVLADPGDGPRVMRLRLYSDASFDSPTIHSGEETAVAAGYDAYCYNDPETGDLLLYDCAAEKATVICAGDGNGTHSAVARYLSPDKQYVVYDKFKDGGFDSDNAYLYDVESGEETVYPLPTVESVTRPFRYKAGIGGTIYFFENASGENELTDRCWIVKDGGEAEELTLPFQYRNGSEPLEKANAIILTDEDYDVKQTEASAIYIIGADGAFYVADYKVPAKHWLADAAISGDRMVLTVYEGGHRAGDGVYYLIETGFSKIG